MDGNTYWVSWIVNGTEGKALAMFSQEAHLSLEEAKKIIEKVKVNPDTVCAWVDCFSKDRQKIGTPIMECYIDIFGQRRFVK